MADITLMSARAAATVLGISPKTLHLWRRKRKGPSFIRVGDTPRYTREDLEKFVVERRVQ